MVLEYQVKIGLAPIRRDVTPRPGIFNWEKAEERGRKLVEYIEDAFSDDRVSFVDTKGITPVDVLITEEDARAAAERFRSEGVDGVVLLNSNFGNEEAGALLARELGKPVLIFAPLDDVFEADGTRYTDSQCGLFGLSRQLQRCGIPFSYIESCRVEDDLFARGLQKFASVCCMVKNFQGMRVAQVGLRPKPFCSVIFNEGELLQRFGIQTVPVNLAVVMDKYNRILRERDAELEEGARLLEGRYEIDDLSAPLLKKVYAFVLLYEEIIAE